MRGIVRVFEVFVQLLGLKLAVKLPNYVILPVNQMILNAGSTEKPKELSKKVGLHKVILKARTVLL